MTDHNDAHAPVERRDAAKGARYAGAAEGLIGTGVQALIDRLKEDGINAGRAEAEALVRQARVSANELQQEARAEAERIVTDARAQAAREQAATRDGLQIAARDLVLDLRNELEARLSEEVSRLVSASLQDPGFLRELITAIAVKAVREAGMSERDKPEFILPERALTFEELKKSPEALAEGSLTGFVSGLAADLFRGGVTFAAAPGFTGIKVRLADKDVLVEVTTDAVASLLARHLQPRLRAVMEGVLR